MTGAVDIPRQLDGGESEEKIRNKLGQDVILAGLVNEVFDKNKLTEVLTELKLDKFGYSQAVGSLFVEGYIVPREVTDEQGHSSVAGFDLTDAGWARVTEDVVQLSRVYRAIEITMSAKKINQALAALTLEPTQER